MSIIMDKINYDEKKEIHNSFVLLDILLITNYIF